MFTHILEDQAKALQQAGLLREGVSTEDVMKCLRQKCWTDQIAIVWNAQDVLDCAKNLTTERQGKRRKIKLTRGQAQEVLEQCLNRADASVGITWDTIEIQIREYLQENPA
jgi:putative NIF3 family GTP cyclohydrolase 1 type 2